MFRHGLVGVDGSGGGRDAVALARALAPERLTLVHAHRPDRHPWPAGHPDPEADRDAARRLLEAARVALGADAELVTVADASPARALQQVAQEREADLIVVGSAHHGAVGRIVLGDVGRVVLHDAPCPVAVAPKDFDGAAPRQVAVGCDGTPESQAAVDAARDLVATHGGALTVYVVWEAPVVPVTGAPGAPAYVSQGLPERRRWAEETLEETLARLPGATAGKVLNGRPRIELEAIASRHDLLVVGSRGWGTARRVALGSTSDWLVHHAACPVLVVPRPADGADPAPPRRRRPPRPPTRSRSPPPPRPRPSPRGAVPAPAAATAARGPAGAPSGAAGAPRRRRRPVRDRDRARRTAACARASAT
ncbi:universal stress protein [Baekduia soli]|nr:universal stress protein [Baekduia soli]